MSLGEKIIGPINEKTREFSNKLSQKYRDHLGEELNNKEEKLKSLQIELEAREKAISKREANLKKFYLVRRSYIDIPIVFVIIIIVASYFVYKPKPDIQNITSEVNSSNSSSSVGDTSYERCVERGVAYYIEIGRFPILSTGEYAQAKVEGICRQTGGKAFK